MIRKTETDSFQKCAVKGECCIKRYNRYKDITDIKNKSHQEWQVTSSQAGSGVSILGDFQDWTQESPEQPHPIMTASHLGSGSCSRRPLEIPSRWNNSLTHNEHDVKFWFCLFTALFTRSEIAWNRRGITFIW